MSVPTLYRVSSSLKTLAGIGLFSSLLSILPASEDPFISVDFSGDGRFGQSQWENWLFSSGLTKEFQIADPLVTMNGSLTVSLVSDSGNFVVRDRATTGFASGFTATALYRDLFIASKSGEMTSSTLTITFSGLKANSTYEVFFYALDVAKNSSVLINTEIGSDSSAWDSINYTANAAANYTAETSLGIAGTSNIVTTDASGVLSFSITNSLGDREGFLNGFQIAAVIPEPATTVLAAGLSILLLTVLVRRSRAAKSA